MCQLSGGGPAVHPRLFIGFVSTANRFKRMGIATTLVSAAEEWGRRHGLLSVPFWERRMGYDRRAVILRTVL